jgi:hypothetical protein
MNPSDFRRNVENAYCHYSIDPSRINNFTELQALVKADLCAPYTVPSAALLGRCVPGKLVDASNSIAGNTTLNDFIKQFGDGNGLIPGDDHIAASAG